MKTVLAREPQSRFTLIYGNRKLQSTMFKEELEDLKNRYMTRLVLHHVFSGEPTDAPLNMGRMDRAKLGEFLSSVVPAGSIDHAYICGPFQMNDEAEAALLAAGVPAERIKPGSIGPAAQYNEVRIDPQTGEVTTSTRRVLPSHFKCPQSGNCLDVENPEVWVYPEGVLDDLTPEELGLTPHSSRKTTP
jgi:ferredoxin-NADP reductase